ncbi:MAG: hypothetical protein WBO66_02990 [Candidatus Moraniibacteriota bacterium]
MSNHIWIATIFFLFSFIACSTSSIVLDKDYGDQNVMNKSITIVKLFDSPDISNADDVIDDLGEGDPAEVYTNFFKERFLATFKNSSYFRSISFVDSFPKAELKPLDINVNGEIIKAYLPNKKSKFEKITTDYILFIYDVSASRSSASSGSFVGGLNMGGSFGTLNHRLEFALWDSESMKLASYGIAYSTSDVPFNMVQKNWAEAIWGLAINLLKKSPFKLRA